MAKLNAEQQADRLVNHIAYLVQSWRIVADCGNKPFQSWNVAITGAMNLLFPRSRSLLTSIWNPPPCFLDMPNCPRKPSSSQKPGKRLPKMSAAARKPFSIPFKK